MSPVSPAQAVWLLARLRLLRLLNLMAATRFFRKKKPAGRVATPGKRRLGLVLPLLMFAMMLFSFGNMAHQMLINLQCHVSPASACMLDSGARVGQIDRAVALHELTQAAFSPALSAALALVLWQMLAVALFLPLGSRELSQADWDLEWLVTLPVRRSTLLWGRLCERSLASPVGWLALLPVCFMLAWFSGWRWSAPLLALGAALVLLPIAALLRTVADTGLRMSLSPSQLRNLQAFAGFIGLPFLYMTMGLSQPAMPGFLLTLVRAAPPWLVWTPPGLLIRTINAPSLAQAGASLGLLLLELALLLWLGIRLLQHQLRDGVVASGARESGRQPAAAPGMAASRLPRWLPLSPIQRRELRLLSRDRNFLVQSLLLPLIIIGGQVMVQSHDFLSGLVASPSALAATAFGLGSYMLMLSAFQTINNEGQALWMLFTFPQPLDHILKDKAKLWAVLALVYPLALFAGVIALAPSMAGPALGLFVIVLIGVPVFSAIAVALGVFASDPLAEDARNKMRPSYVYLYMMLASLYSYAILAGRWSHKLALMVLTICLAQALWQKARDALPYLLDNAAAPPARVSTSDGIIAAMLFFVLQALGYGWLFKLDLGPPAQSLVFAFGIAGLLVYALTRYVYLRAGTRAVPPVLGGAGMLGWGLAMGLLAAVAGLAYLALLKQVAAPDSLPRGGAMSLMALGWVVGLALIAAPLCEEFIFRGLIFGGMRRSLGLLPAMAMSAGLFAIVHPPASMLPVFVLGLCSAYAFERSRSLLAPMLAHAIYNGAIIGFQLLR